MAPYAKPTFAPRWEMANVCWGGLLGIDSAEGDDLAPNDDPTTWVQRIASEPADLMLVGHLPHLGPLASVLLTCESSRELIGFQPGGLVALDREDAGWLLPLASVCRDTRSQPHPAARDIQGERSARLHRTPWRPAAA